MARSGINKREIDKWARNLVKETNKSLERAQRRNPPRVSAQIEATSGAVPGEVTGYLARLLLWLDDREKQNSGGYIDVAAFPEELRLEGEDPAILALQLDQHDLVQILRAIGPQDPCSPHRRRPRRGARTEGPAEGPRCPAPSHDGRPAAVAVRHRQ